LVQTEVTVQAFIDSSSPATHKMDAIEDKGPVRTVTFFPASSLTWTTAIDTPAATDTSLAATVSTVPDVNGNYITAPTVKFTRQGSTAVVESAAAAWSNVNNNWATTISLTDTKNWVGLPNFLPVATSAATIADKKIDVVTSAAHGLATADVVSFITTSTDDSGGAGSGVSMSAASNVVTYVGATAFAVPAEGTISRTKGATADTTAYVVVKSLKLTDSVATKTVATYTTAGTHRLRVGDFVTIVSSRTGIFSRSSRVAVTAAPTTTTFSVALATAQDAVTVTAADTGQVTYDSFEKAALGTYTARAFFDSANVGATAEAGTINVAAASTRVSTVSSSSVQGVSAAGAAGTIKVKAGTLSVPVTMTVLDADGDALGAGHPVKVKTLNPTGAVTVNARSTQGQVLFTDASGQVTLTVASSTGAAGHSIVVEVTPENVVGAEAGFTMTWGAVEIGLVDLTATEGQLTPSATFNRVVIEDGSYNLNLMVADQFFTAVDAAAYRLLISGDGVAGGPLALVAGKATVKVSDFDIAATWDSVVKLQKLTGSTWADTATYTFRTTNIAAATVSLSADGSNANGTTADLSDAVAKVALVELDKRVTSGASPNYVNDVIVNGRITNKSTGAGLVGALVTISGASNILFESSDKVVAARSSITVLSDANGRFEVKLYSTSAQKDSVVTVATLGASSTTKVTFTGIGVGEGTSLVVTMPAAVKPASTFQVKAKLSDVFGNGVNAGDTAVKVTYTGAGIVFGTLPTTTDANGELMFSVLLGSNDTGSVNVTVSYDQNGDGDYVDAKDLNASGTTAITASGVVAASSDTIVNVGTFSGKLVVYALNAAGSEVSYKIAGKWVTQVVTSDLLQRYDRVVGATGKTIKVDIYVDGVLKLAKSVVTK